MSKEPQNQTAGIDAAIEQAARAIAGDGDYMEDCIRFDRQARAAVIAFVKALPGSRMGWNKGGILTALGVGGND